MSGYYTNARHVAGIVAANINTCIMSATTQQTQTNPNAGLCGYKGFYNKEETEIWAADLYSAKAKVIEHFKVPKSKQGLVAVVLCVRKDGSEVIHTPDF